MSAIADYGGGIVNDVFNKKIGYGDHTKGVALHTFLKKNHRAGHVDGVSFHGNQRHDVTSVFGFDPDCWVLRLHVTDGKGRSGVWSGRTVSDHRHKHDVKEHRGGMVIDQSREQIWAWWDDLIWITDTAAKVSDRELKFDGLGFLGMLSGPGLSGRAARGAVALNVSKKGAFTHDGKKTGQLFHLLTWRAAPQATPPGGGPGGTTAAARGGGAQAVYVADQLCLRGDLTIRMPDGTLGTFDHEFNTPDEEGDDVFRVHMFFDQLGGVAGQLDMADDKLSNQPTIPMKPAKKMAGWFLRPHY